MINFWIETENFEPDFFGVQNFATIPSIGTSISILDRNSNSHELKVLSVRQQGWKPDSEVAEILQEAASKFGVHLVCTTDTAWKIEVKEAE